MQQPAPAQSSARALWHQSLALQAQLKRDSAFALLQRANATAPHDLTIHLDYTRRLSDRLGRGALSIIANAATRGDVLSKCSRTGMPVLWGSLARERLHPLLADPALRQCAAYYLALASDSIDPAISAVADRSAPEIGWLPMVRATRRIWRGDHHGARGVIDRALPAIIDPIERVDLLTLRVRTDLGVGDTAAASRAWASIQAALERDGRPGLRFAHVGHAQVVLTTPAQMDSLRREALAIAEAAGSAIEVATTYTALGRAALNHGDLEHALSYLGRAVSASARAQGTRIPIQALVARGRAYSKRGDWSLAVADLNRAATLAAQLGEVYEEADAYHNLAHVYEGQSNWPQARRHADRFVALAASVGVRELAIISLRDAGIITWRSGQLAAADRYFDRMVKQIDAYRSSYNWAGEHFERRADLLKARKYYQLSLLEGGDSARAYGGLVRIHLQLGSIDSARVMAAAHDRVQQTPEETPLLPLVHARRGNIDGAIAVAARWSALQERRGNMIGAARTHLLSAELLLAARRYDDAERAAVRAQEWAQKANAVNEKVAAAARQAAARVGARDAAGALRLLATVEPAVATLPAATRLVVFEALAAARTASGDVSGALAAYTRAADAVAEAASPLNTDFDRIRYSDANLTPFDRAIALLLSGERPDPNAILLWSAAKKDASMHRGSLRQSDVREIQRSLGPGQMFVDYVISGQQLAATAVTRSRARTTVLAVRLDSVQRQLFRLRAPFERVYEGRVDLARLHFDSAAARTLYEDLVAPLNPAGTITELLISPDGVLGLLPFDLLLNGPAFVVERYAVAYTPSAITAGGRAGPFRLDGEVALMGGNAPGVANELNAVRSMTGSAQPIVSSETAARERFARAQVLHIASHARASLANPLESHITLQADERHDGLLHASEIAGLVTSARLTVLTGCETITGKVHASAGVVGLARAFLVAGSESVIATQWPVSATAAQFSATLYGELKRGVALSAAVRASKLAMLREPRTRHPFHWAPYVLITTHR